MNEQITMLTKVIGGMVNEAKNTDISKKAKSQLKEDINKLRSTQLPKKLIKDIFTAHKVRKQLIKEMLNSDEVGFIKTVVKESEQGKKIAGKIATLSQKVEVVSEMVPYSIKREVINYDVWVQNYITLIKFVLSVNPVKLMEYFLKYEWMFELVKCNGFIGHSLEGRTGANHQYMSHSFKWVIKAQCTQIADMLNHPDMFIMQEYTFGAEIISGMGLYSFPIEFCSIMVKLDQWSVSKYIDEAHAHGVGVDSCALPKVAAGFALRNEIMPGLALIAGSYPCDSGFSIYNYIENRCKLPVHYLDFPYNLRGDEYLPVLVDGLKSQIAFLEEKTPGRMDWDRLRHICDIYNELVDIEMEKWEMAKLDKPSVSGDAIQQLQFFTFAYFNHKEETLKNYRWFRDTMRKNVLKGKLCFDTMRYRAIVWSLPPSGWTHWSGWLERCWGIAVLMDMETYGAKFHIDTTTPETMLEGLGKRYMRQLMIRHTLGPSSNCIEDYIQVIDDYRPDFIIIPQLVGCKNMMSMDSTLREIAKKRNLPICGWRMELNDMRITSRQQCRNEISKFMTEVMHAEPLDASLLQIDDSGW